MTRMCTIVGNVLVVHLSETCFTSHILPGLEIGSSFPLKRAFSWYPYCSYKLFHCTWVESDILRPHLHKNLQRIKVFSSVIQIWILQNSNPNLVLHSAIVYPLQLSSVSFVFTQNVAVTLPRPLGVFSTYSCLITVTQEWKSDWSIVEMQLW